MKKEQILLFLALVLLGCNSNIEAFQEWSKDENAALMEKEMGVLGKHSQALEFHRMMLMECTDQSKDPYPQMRLLLDSMTILRNSIQQRRMDLKAERAALWENGDASKKKMEEEKVRAAEAHRRTVADTLAFSKHYEAYQGLIEEHGIVFISHSMYADSLLNRLIQWEDSLEYQGGSIAKSKRRLDELGMKNSSKIYLDYYQPISQMQLIHKEFQGMLIGLENAHSRYLTARPDEGFFYGPYLVDRPDVLMTERIFDRLDSTMSVFRQEERNAFLKLRR